MVTLSKGRLEELVFESSDNYNISIFTEELSVDKRWFLLDSEIYGPTKINSFIFFIVPIISFFFSEKRFS